MTTPEPSNDPPPGRWLLISAGLHAAVWLPLALLALPLGPRAVLASVAISALFAGAVIGRFAETRPVACAAGGGVVAALGFFVIAVAGGAVRSVTLGAITLGACLLSWAALATIGGKIGARHRAEPPDR